MLWVVQARHSGRPSPGSWPPYIHERLIRRENHLPRNSHLNGFSPVCTRRCTERLSRPRSSNITPGKRSGTNLTLVRLLYSVHVTMSRRSTFRKQHATNIALNGFSPLCTRLCVERLHPNATCMTSLYSVHSGYLLNQSNVLFVCFSPKFEVYIYENPKRSREQC